MVEIFKTNVEDAELAKHLTAQLLSLFPGYRINFDLHDCDNILRVEGKSVCIDEIIEAMNGSGYQCHVLD
jgi:hypothetical protein